MNPADVTKWRVSHVALDTLMSEEAKQIRERENNVKKQLADITKKLKDILNEQKIIIKCSKLHEDFLKTIEHIKSKALKFVEIEFYKAHEVQAKTNPTIQCELKKPDIELTSLEKIRDHIKNCKHKDIHKQVLESIIHCIIAWKDKHH